MFYGITSECQKRAQAKYDAEHTRRYSLKLNLTKDRDIINWLWGQHSVQGTIKRLIRQEMAREAEEQSKRSG